MLYVKRMALVKAAFKDGVDLRDYEDTIMRCVHEVIPTATVIVHRYFYETQTKKEITPTEARLVGRKMGKTRFSQFLIEHHYKGGYDGRSGKIFKELKY